MATKKTTTHKSASKKTASRKARKEKYDLSKSPTMSDEFLMGSAPTLSSLRITKPADDDSDLD